MHTEEKDRVTAFRKHLVEFCKDKCTSENCHLCIVSRIYKELKEVENKDNKED